MYKVMDMRTNIDIDQKLVEEAMHILGVKTRKETVEIALLSLVNSYKRRRILDYQGKLHWSGDLDEMRDLE